MHSRPTTTEERTKAYFKTVEAGDLALFDIFKESIAVFGYTKVGKTTSCHMLTNRSPLRADAQQGELIYKATQPKYKNAIIGSTNESQTEIPNIFEAKFRDSKGVERAVTILDQPGYGDSYGFHRIFSNGYFHYRTFSKTPLLKFIIVVNKSDLLGTAERFKKTISMFVNTFKEYESIKSTILGATSLLITKTDSVPKQTTMQDLHSILTGLRDGAVGGMGQVKKARFQEFIDEMVSKDKVFQIHKPERATVVTKDSDILRQIYEKTEFWQRPEIGGEINRVVDMSDINFSVSNDILAKLSQYNDDDYFREEFTYFMDYMEKRMESILIGHKYSFRGIIEMLRCDAMDTADSNRFLGGMEEFVNEYFAFIPDFSTKRKETIMNLFKGEEEKDSETGSMTVSTVGSPTSPQKHEQRVVLYFIRKFEVLDFVVDKAQQVIEVFELTPERNVQQLQQISELFMSIFRKFNLLRRNKGDTQKVISKYSYLVTRLIEEAKIISLILFTNNEVREKFDAIKQGMVDIYRLVHDKLFNQQISQICTSDLKREFLHHCDPESFQIVNSQLITFFEQIMYYSEDLKLPVSNLVLRYASDIEGRSNSLPQEKRFVARKICHFRSQFFEYYQSLEEGNKDKSDMVERIFLLTNALGRILTSLNEFKLARQVFESVRNVVMVLRVYDLEIANAEDDSIQLHISNGQYAESVLRRDVAMRCYQQAYSKAKTYAQMTQISARISHVGLEKPEEEEEGSYLSKMYNKDFCEDFDEDMKMNLELALTQLDD